MNTKLLNYLIFYYLINVMYTIRKNTSVKHNNGSDIGTKILGGHNATIEEVPWQAAIMDTFNQFLCGATIIHHEWVITSALCLGDTTYGFVRYESTELAGYARVVEIKKVIKHEYFHLKTKDYDIALVKTQNMELNYNAYYI
ncbi:Coagulation factor X [Blomia tropicalis]|nr:Coagulation factor X [Blomia tropicalis]